MEATTSFFIVHDGTCKPHILETYQDVYRIIASFLSAQLLVVDVTQIPDELAQRKIDDLVRLSRQYTTKYMQRERMPYLKPVVKIYALSQQPQRLEGFCKQFAQSFDGLVKGVASPLQIAPSLLEVSSGSES